MNKCNCGRDVRYSHFVDGEEIGSCNKHRVCESWDSQNKRIAELETKYSELLEHANNSICYRETSEYYQDAERFIRKEFENKK